jgi:hypothetical protein
MSEQNRNQTPAAAETTTPATPATPAAEASKEKRVMQLQPRDIYETREAAEAVKPTHARVKLFRVGAADGSVSLTYGVDGWNAIYNVGKAQLGLVAVEAGKAPSKEQVGGLLAAMTPEERAALLQQHLPAAPAAEKGRKGK